MDGNVFVAEKEIACKGLLCDTDADGVAGAESSTPRHWRILGLRGLIPSHPSIWFLSLL